MYLSLSVNMHQSYRFIMNVKLFVDNLSFIIIIRIIQFKFLFFPNFCNISELAIIWKAIPSMQNSETASSTIFLFSKMFVWFTLFALVDFPLIPWMCFKWSRAVLVVPLVYKIYEIPFSLHNWHSLVSDSLSCHRYCQLIFFQPGC